MLKVFTKSKALEYSDELSLLINLLPLQNTANNIASDIIKISNENISYVQTIQDCEIIVLPYHFKNFEDPIFDCFNKLSKKYKKPLLCFKNSNDKSHHYVSDDMLFIIQNKDYENLKFYDSNLSEYLINLVFKIQSILYKCENLSWNIINVYTCHIPGKNNNFINDEYDIDTYCFFKNILGKNCKKLVQSHKSETPDITFSSVYGINDPPESKKSKIFYNGESKSRYMYYSNVDRILKKYDYYIGFDIPKNERMFRLPFWMTMFDLYKFDKSNCLGLMNEHYRCNINEKIMDCAMIATTDFNLLRSSFVGKCFEQGIRVYCPSKVCKNHRMPVGREGEKSTHFFKGKLEYLKKFKIEICFENTHEHGYVTEKLFGALFSGCIPVYWGSKFDDLIEEQLINQDRVIVLNKDLSNFEEVIEKVKKLCRDNEYFIKFYEQPIFKKNANSILLKYLRNFNSFIKQSII